MSRACLASSTVTGQFRMRFFARICSKFAEKSAQSADKVLEPCPLLQFRNVRTVPCCKLQWRQKSSQYILVRIRLDGSGSVVEVEAGSVLDELHDQSVRTMDAEGSFNRRVHGYATQFANGDKREDVGQRVGIVPDSPKILDVADKIWVPPLV